MNNKILEHEGTTPVQEGEAPMQMSLELIFQVLGLLSGLATTRAMHIVNVYQYLGVQHVIMVALWMDDISVI